jgi:hypothetical protein
MAMNDEEKWQTEGDVRTLKEAEMIRADPGRMKKAMAMMDDEMKAMMKVQGRSSIEDEAKGRFPETYKK